jgi:hypothetical protein
MTSNQLLALASVDHAGEMAELATTKTSEAWSGASKMLEDASLANADRVQEMAKAVATDGQSLIASVASDIAKQGQDAITENNTKNLYIIGGVSVAAVLSMIVMARANR